MSDLALLGLGIIGIAIAQILHTLDARKIRHQIEVQKAVTVEVIKSTMSAEDARAMFDKLRKHYENEEVA